MPDLKNELSYEVSFLHVLKNQKSNNFFQSFQVDVVRHAQSDLKQQVWTNLGIKFIFCMWLGIHKYIYLIQSIYMSVVKHIWVFQK